MDYEIISELALTLVQEGINAKSEGDLENARAYFAFARAFNELQEHGLGVRICDHLLKDTGVDETEIPYWLDYGSTKVNRALSIIEQVDREVHPERVDHSAPLRKAVDRLFQ
ncbi:MAG: hypothetical protein WC796_06295 [Candidatus Pacearchaeota archaeon]|jgi:hypothetical protein